ncbi:Lrp/AsnC family transcriptional regulator [Natrinema salinisoli]|uniref:Lrp/AsnC family transcriptional regulator n=1 Tax=Natrinema salinisoli TaxID=2878535 RepID=UPI001CEFC053|nr:Lrp/AsnC family transcriptional regulator [Natrinema salinisoli]
MSNTSTQVRKLDELDLEILAILTQNPLWKTALHNTLGKKSIQTIGRRVNDLQDDGLLVSCILSPDTLNRDLVIGYKTTEQGRTALEQHHVCEAPDCDEIVVDGEDHVHEFASGVEYFDASGSE